MTSPQLTQALLREVASKADLVWVEISGPPARALWHVWFDDAIAVVTGGAEQGDPGFVDSGLVTVILRSKDKSTRVLTLEATAELISPDSPEWEDVTNTLGPKRLNAVAPNAPSQSAASTGEEDTTLAQRWARSSRVWLLRPTNNVIESPDNYTTTSHRATPVPTPATTVTHSPYHFGRATKKRKP